MFVLFSNSAGWQINKRQWTSHAVLQIREELQRRVAEATEARLKRQAEAGAPGAALVWRLLVQCQELQSESDPSFPWNQSVSEDFDALFELP